MNRNDRLCVNCFRIIRGGYEVCPCCGFVKGGPAREACQLKPGTILDERYIIGEVIGQGGFGITYRAYDTNLGTVIAVKEFYPSGYVNRAENETKVSVFPGEKARDYEKMLTRFLEEARSAALFWKEPDIVNVLAFFESNCTAYMIMEYIEGTLLKQCLRDCGRMEQQEACAYMCAILTALSKIHARGIIHRDIGPDNIFLTGETSVKLLDFGTARFQEADDEETRSVVIKPGYSPPEQYHSKGKQDVRMDIYAAGAVFFQMLTGRRPEEARDRRERGHLDFSGNDGNRINARLKNDIEKAMALNPNERFASAEEFRIAIEEHGKNSQKSGFFDRFRR
ncbi:MAG: serine/threonine protein kinase [Lachnospiraceae bacterium]|nr:serine/threonine protein kinase [Lachnospiraceae bacterium]